MQSTAYAIGIFTFAVWLSVLGIGGIGMAVTGRFGPPLSGEKTKAPYHDLEAVLLTGDFTGPEEMPREATNEGASVSPVSGEILPEPPALPEAGTPDPLPGLPSLPAPVPEKPRPAPVSAPRQPNSAPRTGKSTARPATAGNHAGNGTGNAGTGMSDARRLGGGRMPAPAYPAEARRKGQTGTVVVEFVVGENGRVVSAHAKNACPWPLLNNAAVRAVRGWKFPASGNTSKFIRPITFKLN